MEKTIDFLKKLKSNNNRDWFEANKEKYLAAREEYETLVDKVIKGVVKFDKQISPDMKGKDCTFRIYKDVRFSKDKTPYKINMGASINPGGKKSLSAGYYLHLEPGGSFLAGGVYMPEPAMLNAIRQEIDYNAAPLLKILKSAAFKKYFKGFDDEGKLKTAPKGFEKDHPHLEMLKNKHFLVSYPISDKQLLAKNLHEIATNGFKAMHPLLVYLRAANGNAS
ncbi:MAG: DUF2461 domain-containing protein [Bacteroidota bacterium]